MGKMNSPPAVTSSTSINVILNKTKPGVALAGLNLPGGPAYTNFTEELFHTEQFQVNFSKTNLTNRHRLISSSEFCQFHDNSMDGFGDRLGELGLKIGRKSFSIEGN